MTPVSFLLEGTFLRSKRQRVLRTRYGELGLTATILDRRIGQCREANSVESSLRRVDAVSKCKGRGGRVPPARHLPLAFGHNTINAGGLGAEPTRCPTVVCSFNTQAKPNNRLRYLRWAKVPRPLTILAVPDRLFLRDVHC